jgi:hypothetical protein
MDGRGGSGWDVSGLGIGGPIVIEQEDTASGVSGGWSKRSNGIIIQYLGPVFRSSIQYSSSVSRFSIRVRYLSPVS